MKKLIFVLVLALVSVFMVSSVTGIGANKQSSLANLNPKNRAQITAELLQPQYEGFQLEGYWVKTNGSQESQFYFKEDGTFRYETLPDMTFTQFVVIGTYEQIGNSLLLRSAIESENTSCNLIFGEYVIELLGEEDIRLDVIGNRCRTPKGLPSAILSHSLERVYP